MYRYVGRSDNITVILYGVHVLFSLIFIWILSHIAQWTTPNITGSKPPPIVRFTLTKITTDRAVMFGGFTPGEYSLEDLRVATIGQNSVVSECVHTVLPYFVTLAVNSTYSVVQ